MLEGCGAVLACLGCVVAVLVCLRGALHQAYSDPTAGAQRDFHHLEPQLSGRSETNAGSFDVWKFPLQFNEYIFYMRRFGVDVPAECSGGEAAPCPVLVDFHGSFDSLYSQRAWTQWHEYQAQAKSKFILLTPEGSPDALYRPDKILVDCNDTSDDCIGASGTSWNVLGWGTLSSPMDEDVRCRSADPQENVYANCFWSTLNPTDAYQCFGTHLVDQPDVCRRTTKGEAVQIPTVCMSASGANDADYLAIALRFVVSHYNADARRIYFSGQSMGGMAALQFATPGGEGSLPAELRPAAIAPCSAGASRSRFSRLEGQVPTLLMWGYTDHISPATVWQGYDRNLSLLASLSQFGQLLKNDSLKEAALKVTGGEPHEMCKNTSCSSKACCAVLQANVMTGGELLKATALHRALDKAGVLGCENTLAELTSIGSAGFLWEGIAATLEGVAGRRVDMQHLAWRRPDGVPRAAQEAIDLLCADVPREGPGRAPSAEVRVCVYNGGHSYPWNGGPAGDNGNEWMSVAGPSGKVFHDFVWEGFFRGGTVLRPAAAEMVV